MGYEISQDRFGVSILRSRQKRCTALEFLWFGKWLFQTLCIANNRLLWRSAMVLQHDASVWQAAIPFDCHLWCDGLSITKACLVKMGCRCGGLHYFSTHGSSSGSQQDGYSCHFSPGSHERVHMRDRKTQFNLKWLTVILWWCFCHFWKIHVIYI